MSLVERRQGESSRADEFLHAAPAAARPLRIAGVDPELRFAGGETQVMGLTRELIRRGHRAELVCNPAGRLWERARVDGVVCHPLKIRNALDIGAAMRLRAILNAGDRFDIVHFHTSRAHAMAPIVRGCARAAVVTRRMDYKPNRFFAAYLYGRGVDRVIAISSAVADSLAQAGVPRSCLTIIASGVDTESFRPPTVSERAKARASLGIDDQTVVISAVGALEPRKGHRYLVKAIASLASNYPDLRCLIAGDGSMKEELAREASSHGCSDQVKLLGRVDDARAVLWASDVFAMPSLLEGLGVATLEAMACALPVVASRAGGLAESIQNGVNGIVVNPSSPDDLAIALRSLLNDPDLRRQLGLSARERVEREYSMTAMAERTLEVYRACLRGRPEKVA